MARKQAVVEDSNADARIFLSDVQRFAATEPAVVTFKYSEELYHVDANQTTLSYLAHDSAPVDPLLAFRDKSGFPYIERGDLKEMPGGTAGGETPVFRVERFKGNLGQLALYSWRGMVEELTRVVERDASTAPDTSLRGMLEYRGGVPPEYMEVATRSQSDQETFGQALVRLDFAQPRDLLFAALGASRLFNPIGHLANGVGRALLDAGAIKPEELAFALTEQVRSGKSLAAIIHANGFAGGDDIAAAFERLKGETLFLPPTDKMGELLVRQEKLSRTQLMSAVFKIQGSGEALSDYLIAEELCAESDVRAAEAWHDLKLRLRTAGNVRLGQILVDTGELKEGDLKRALLLQIERRDPIGEILMAEGLCSPEAVIEALLEQEERLNEQVAAAVAGVDGGKLEKLDLFDVPAAALKGRKKARKVDAAILDTDEEGDDDDRPRKKAAADPRKGGIKGLFASLLGKKEPAGSAVRDREVPEDGDDDDDEHEAAARRAPAAARKDAAKGRTGKEDTGQGNRKAAADAEDQDAPGRRRSPLKLIAGVAVAALLAIGLTLGTITAVNKLSGPGGPLASGPKAPPGGSPSAAPGGPAGGIRQQALSQSQLTGDKTSLSHLSNEELKAIAKKNPGFVTPEDVESRGGNIGEVLAKAEKTDPNLAKAVKAARMTSGANLLNAELDKLENDEGDDPAAITDDPAAVRTKPQTAAERAQAQAGAAASFQSAETAAQGGVGDTNAQFGQAVNDELAPAAMTDAREQLRAFSDRKPPPRRPAGGQPGQRAALGAQGQPPPGQRAALGAQGQPPPGQGAASVPQGQPPGQRTAFVPQGQPQGQRTAFVPQGQPQGQPIARSAVNPVPGGQPVAAVQAQAPPARPAQPEAPRQIVARLQQEQPPDPGLVAAVAKLDEGRDDEAMPMLATVQQDFQAQAVADIKQAQAAVARNDLPAAQTTLLRAARAQVHAASAQAGLGAAYQRQGRSAEAERLLADAAASQAKAGRLQTHLGEVFARQGKVAEAAVAWQTAARLDPASGRPYFLAAKQAMARRKATLARRYIRVALQKEPGAAWAREARAIAGRLAPRPRPRPVVRPQPQPGSDRPMEWLLARSRLRAQR